MLQRALGTMSGTSLDGVDAAVVVTDGERIAGFGPTAYRAYTAEERAVLQAALGSWPSDDVAKATDLVTSVHKDVMAAFTDVDIAGFHGQTLAHDPGGLGTHQIGDGAALAQALGYPVVSDFRSADVAAGGQGAPLAPFYHFALAKWMGADAPIAFLNLGGVGNITWVDPSFDAPEAAGALLAFDTGPANAPINDMMQARFDLPYDADGQLAAQGIAHDGIVAAFMEYPYFKALPPKSLDRDAFADLPGMIADLADKDAAATLVAIVAASVKAALRHCPVMPQRLLVCGGGRRNSAIIAQIAAIVSCDVQSVEAVDLDGDMLEAQAFGYLAVRAARGLPISAPGTTGVSMPTCGGRYHT